MLKMNLLMLGIAVSSLIAFTQEQYTNGPMRDYPMRDYAIHFDELSSEFEVTSYYDGITFEAYHALVTYPWANGTSPPNIIMCHDYTQHISITFSPGVYNLTFLVSDLHLVGHEADIVFFENGSSSPSGIIMVEGNGTPWVPVMVDLSGNQNITQIDIINISGNGEPAEQDDIFLDDFLFSKYCSSPQDLTLEGWPAPGAILSMIDLLTALCP